MFATQYYDCDVYSWVDLAFYANQEAAEKCAAEYNKRFASHDEEEARVVEVAIANEFTLLPCMIQHDERWLDEWKRHSNYEVYDYEPTLGHSYEQDFDKFMREHQHDLWFEFVWKF